MGPPQRGQKQQQERRAGKPTQSKPARIECFNQKFEEKKIFGGLQVPAIVLVDDYIKAAVTRLVDGGFIEVLSKEAVDEETGLVDLKKVPWHVVPVVARAAMLKDDKFKTDKGKIEAFIGNYKGAAFDKLKHLSKWARACCADLPNSTMPRRFKKGCQATPDFVKHALGPYVERLIWLLPAVMNKLAEERRQQKNPYMAKKVVTIDGLDDLRFASLNLASSERFVIIPGIQFFRLFLLHLFLRDRGADAAIRELLGLPADAVIDHYLEDVGFMFTCAMTEIGQASHRDGPNKNEDKTREVHHFTYLQNMEGNNGHIKLDIGVGQPKSNGDIPLVGKYGCLLLSQNQKMYGYTVLNGWAVHGVLPNLSDKPRLVMYATYHRQGDTGKIHHTTPCYMTASEWKVREAGPYPLNVDASDRRISAFHYYLRVLYKSGELDDVPGIDAAAARLGVSK